MQEGMNKEETLSVAEEQAFQLSRCAIAIDQARTSPSELTAALNANLELWIAIRTMAEHNESNLTPEIRQNLATLSKFVASKVFESSEGLNEETLNTLININLQISEGLLEGAGGRH